MNGVGFEILARTPVPHLPPKLSPRPEGKVHLKGNNYSLWEKFFLFRIDPFLEGALW